MADKPTLIAYTVLDFTTSEGQKKSRWREIGAAWPTKNGGFTVTLFAVPVDGKLTLSPPLPPKEAGEEA